MLEIIEHREMVQVGIVQGRDHGKGGGKFGPKLFC